MNLYILKLRLLLVGYVVVLTALLLYSDPDFWFICAAHAVGLSHFIGFGFLGFLSGYLLPDYRLRTAVISIALLLVYCTATEIVQEWIPPRSFTWGDLIQNFLGISIGLFFGYTRRSLEIEV